MTASEAQRAITVEPSPGLCALVPFDDSPSAWRAVHSVPSLNASAVVLLTVLEDCPDLSPDAMVPGTHDGTPGSEQLWLRLQQARSALERARAALLEDGWEGDCQLVLRCGQAAREILAVAGEHRVSMIAMGAHRLLGIRRPLLGPVATQVLRDFDGGGVYLVR